MDYRYTREGIQFAKTLFALACLLLGQLQGGLRAETLTIYGVPFQVNSLIRVDDRTVKIEQGGQSALIARDGVEDWLVRLYFSSPERSASLSTSEIKVFTEGALKAGKITYAAKGLVGFLWRQPQGPSSVFVEQLATIPASGEIFKIALTEVGWKEKPLDWLKARVGALDALLFRVGIVDPVWLRANVLSLVYLLPEDFKDYIFRRFVDSASEGSLTSTDQCAKIVALVLDLFGAEDVLSQRLRGVLSRLVQFDDLVARHAVEEVFPLINLCRQESVCYRILYPKIAEYVYSVSEGKIADGKANDALFLLARLDISRRTPRTHELILKALFELKLENCEILLDEKVASMLGVVSENDNQVKAEYEKILLRKIWSELKSNETEKVDPFLSLLAAVRPDPNTDNDDIRIFQAMQYLDRDLKEPAAMKLGEVKTGLSLSDRLQLGFSGLYISRTGFIILLVMFIALSICYISIQVRRIAKKIRERAQQASEMATTGKVRSVLDPRYQEYLRCLSVLGIKKDATLADIKTAYRNAVKLTHPDIADPSDKKAKTDFVAYNEAYEKILDFRQLIEKVGDGPVVLEKSKEAE